MNSKLILFVASGFGLGRIPAAQGTFGSVLGLAWLALLLASGSWWVLALGIVAGTAASVWLAGESEKILKATDPGYVVIDEVIAIPISFVGWLIAAGHGALPGVHFVFVEHWPVVLVIFGLFRLFDIAKPWPVGKSQSLPGGWGVTIDDVLAAVYVNVIALIAHAMGWM